VAVTATAAVGEALFIPRGAALPETASTELLANRPKTVPAIQAWLPLAGTFALSPASRIVIGSASPGLLVEARQLANDLEPVVGRMMAIANQPGDGAQPGDIVLELSTPDQQLGAEGYFLVIASAFTISAPTTAGVFYGGRTLLQLLHQGPLIPCGMARDWPRYPERGLMLDLVGGTQYSPEWLEAEIQRLAYLKLNLLHLHMTDDGGWGIECDSHPELTSPNALTKDDVRSLLASAARYHVTILPEVEVLGHMGAFMEKSPGFELKIAGAYDTSSASEYVTDKLDITNPDALEVIEEIINEYIPLFPSPYWHMGGDEYLSPAEIPLFPQLSVYAIEKYGPGASVGDAIHGYINWINGIVRGQGKILRAWNDQFGGTVLLPVDPTVAVEWWTDASPFGDPLTISPAALVSQGHRVLNAGWYPCYYASDIGPQQGTSNMEEAFEDWQVNQFCGPLSSDVSGIPPQTVAATDERVTGSMISVWTGESVEATEAGIAPRLAVISQKTWDSSLLAGSYAEFENVVAAVGSGAPAP
jgi:hexosaminidase